MQQSQPQENSLGRHSNPGYSFPHTVQLRLSSAGVSAPPPHPQQSSYRGHSIARVTANSPAMVDTYQATVTFTNNLG